MAPVIEELTNFSDEYGGDLPDESVSATEARLSTIF